MDENKRTQDSYWAEILSDYDELEGCDPEHDIIKCICIDAYKSSDGDEDGRTIAKVILTKSGDIGVIYIDHIAYGDAYAQEVIKEVLDKLNEKSKEGM